MSEKAKTLVRRHPKKAINQLVGWCVEHADARALDVAAVGLPLFYGLNEHQLATATVCRAGDCVTLEYPVERKPSRIRGSERRPLEITEPNWLLGSLQALGTGTAPVPLFRPRRRIGNVGPGKVRQLVADAAAEATGLVMSCATLVSTRNAELSERKLSFGLYERGWAPSYVARLIDPAIEPIVPRRRSR